MFVKHLALLISNIFVFFVFYGVAGHCIQYTATKGKMDLKRSLEFLPMHSSALGSIERIAVERKWQDRSYST
jgi:hypothetical protein